jgi:hypothetical protein
VTEELFALGYDVTGTSLRGEPNAGVSDEANDPNAPIRFGVVPAAEHTLPRIPMTATGRVEFVIRGSLQIGDKILHDGDASVSKPGEPTVHTSAGLRGASRQRFSPRRRGVPAFEGELDRAVPLNNAT